MADKQNRGITREIMLLSLAIFFADASHSTVIPIFPGFAQKVGASLSMLGSYSSVAAFTMLDDMFAEGCISPNVLGGGIGTADGHALAPDQSGAPKASHQRL